MRKLRDFIIPLVAGGCALIALGILIGLVHVVAQRGGPALNWGFFTEQMRSVGAAGGILWNLVGTTILLVAAFLLCAPLAIALALVERVWLGAGKAHRALRATLYTVN